MIRVDETDPVGELEPSFPYRDVTVRRGVEFKDCYDVQSEIGRGKFGTVYRCKEKSSGLSLAAKVVNTNKKEDRRAVEREVEIMRRLQHPRLIQLYDAIDTGRQIYVILELIEGGELFERVIDDDFVLTERSCAVFMRQICEGVEFIHAQKILHLDLKPENILCLTKEGNRIKIIDFGLAREFDPNKKLQVLFGTPEFVAPEVVNFDQIGFGTDMWSIGVICYVLLSGLSPFMGDTDIETMANVTIAKYDFDHDAFADISEDAKDFIRCLLIKDKEKRASAAQCRQHRWLVKRKNPQQEQRKNDLQIHEISSHLSQLIDKPMENKNNNNDDDELDMTKDNLRLFVERWREHPNSPYLLDSSHQPLKYAHCNTIEETVSLQAQSPSPRESLCSSPPSEDTISSSPRDNYGYLLNIPGINLALERRASEGMTKVKSRDAVSQIVLAEEIIKLSEHLRSIASGGMDSTTTRHDEENEDEKKIETSANSTKSKELEKQTIRTTSRKNATTKTNEKRSPLSSSSSTATLADVSSDYNEITEKLSSITRQRKLNGTTFHSSRSFDKFNESNSSNTTGVSFLKLKRSGGASTNRSNRQDNSSILEATKEENEMDLTPPWRRPRKKYSFSETSRDVPRISNLQDLHKSLNLDEPSNTKDLLLHLLGEWEEIGTCSNRSTGMGGRKSVSVDWYGEESVARKTINSLAEYFQSKRDKSADSSVMDTNSSPPIRR